MPGDNFLAAPAARAFTVLADGVYRLDVPDLGLQLDVDRLRRERHELVGELSVRCALSGVRTVDGIVSIGSFNLSSPTARTHRAKLLREQGDVDLDFLGFLEELCQRTLAAERAGSPSRPLSTFDRPGPAAELDVDGWRLPRHHPGILFGDGGSVKSYLALYAAGRLAQQGLRVQLCDWELDGSDHRERLERLFGLPLPVVHYERCDRPLVDEADRIRQDVRRLALDYVIYDSIAFAVGGPPEAAEGATAYFRAVRQIGPTGSLHLAHISKAENGDQKPFGSAFWHNSARATWFVKSADLDAASDMAVIGLYNRKANLTRLAPPIGFAFTFSEDRTAVRRVDVADIADLAAQLTVRQRMAARLRRGPMSPELLASEIEADLETIKRTARRYKRQFTLMPGGSLALQEHRA